MVYRRAEILERKRRKKLRQKEQKERGLKLEDEAEMKNNGISTPVDSSSVEALSDPCGSGEHNPDTLAVHESSLLVPLHCTDANEGVDGVSLSVYENGIDQNIEQETTLGHVCQHIAVDQPKSQWAVANGLHPNHNSQFTKSGATQKHESHLRQKAASMLNGNKVWSRKSKQNIIGVHSKAKLEKESDEGKNHEVLIGSISITLGNCSQSEDNLVSYGEDYLVGNSTKHSNAKEKPVKPDSVQISNNPSIAKAVKLWRPVTHHGTKDALPHVNVGPEANAIDEEKDYQNLSNQNSSRLCDLGKSDSNLEGNVGPRNLHFSSEAAKAFLEESKLCHLHIFFKVSSVPPTQAK